MDAQAATESDAPRDLRSRHVGDEVPQRRPEGAGGAPPHKATAFRKWAPHGGAQTAVPGLEQAFLRAGLPSHVSAAEAWCQTMGAAYLSEVLENVDDFCDHLGPPGPKKLSAAELRRLRAGLSEPDLDDCGAFEGQTKSAQGRLAPWEALSPSTPAAAWGGELPETKTTATKAAATKAPPRARRW